MLLVSLVVFAHRPPEAGKRVRGKVTSFQYFSNQMSICKVLRKCRSRQSTTCVLILSCVKKLSRKYLEAQVWGASREEGHGPSPSSRHQRERWQRNRRRPSHVEECEFPSQFTTAYKTCPLTQPFESTHASKSVPSIFFYSSETAMSIRAFTGPYTTIVPLPAVISST